MEQQSIFTEGWETLCLHELFERQVRAMPDAPALWTQEGGRRSYQELNAHANQTAHWLRRRGIGPECVVGLSMARSADFFACLWGVLKAGGAWLYLAPDVPGDRLSAMMDDAGAVLILTDRCETPWSAAVPTYVLPNLRAALARESTENPTSGATLSSLAYVLYTSGTTERKGVQVTHRGLGRLARAQIDGFGVVPEDRFSQFLLPSFDAFLSELVTASLAGAALYVVPDENRRLPAALLAFLQRERITVGTFTPSALLGLPPSDLPNLRVLVVGGEVCNASLVSAWTAPGRRVFNAYGPTEATVCVSFGECRPTGQPPTLGRPLPEVSVTIRNTAHLPVVEGKDGEICVGGPCLARGYTGPEQTAGRFISDPLDAGERIYLTGDRGRFTGRGELVFLGRLDEEMKLPGGFRVSPGEIEVALATFVEESAVLLVGQVLVACVVPLPGARPMVEEHFRVALSERLPSHMVPHAFLVLSALPRTSSEKIDRAALRERVRESWAGLPVRQAVTEVERQVSRLAVEVLRFDSPQLDAETLDINLSLVRLGVPSLRLMEFLLHIEEQFGLELKPLEVYSQPLADVAQLIEQERGVTV